MASQLLLAQKPFIQLQIEALVEENSIKPEKIIEFFDKLKERLLAIKENKYEKLLNKQLRLPFIGRPNGFDADYPHAFRFKPPEEVKLIGSITTATAIKGKTHVDIAVIMPSKCLEKKDAKNQRYHRKRALYLAQLAHILNSGAGTGLIDKLEFRYHQGNLLRPVLTLIPKDYKLKKLANFQLFIHVEPNDCPFKTSILDPSHGNLAPKWFFQDLTPAESDGELNNELKEFVESDSETTSSPYYNSSILTDLELISNSQILSEQIGNQTSIAEATILTKVWLLQIGISHHFSFITTMFVAYLQSKQIIHQNMSSFQVFKQIIKSLATREDWSKEGLSYFDDSQNKVEEFKKHFPVVFLSPSGRLNLCYNITSDLYKRLKHEANLADRILNEPTHQTFDLLLLKKREFYDTFDAIVHLPKFSKKIPIKKEFLQKYMDYGINSHHTYSEEITNILEKALTDRILLLQQNPENLTLAAKRWNFKSIPYDPTNSDTTFTFGLLLDGEKSLRVIDVGPPADSSEAQEFQKFWEPKSQLRLQDGMISETVVWHVDSFSQRRSIVKFILTHTLRKLNINQMTLHYTILERSISLNNVFFKWRDTISISKGGEPQNNNNGQEQPLADKNGRNQCLSNKRKHNQHNNRNQEDPDSGPSKPIGVGEEIFQKVLHGYNELNKILRNLKEMKHDITGIQPISSHLRSSSVFPPLPVGLQPKNKSLKRRKGVTLFPENFDQAGKVLHIDPIEFLVTLESSSKWPNDWEALEAAKQEYLIQVCESLRSQFSYAVRLADGGSHLDILHGQFVYRLQLRCPKELNLISSLSSKQEFQNRRLELEIGPRIHAALDQLYREKIAFATTCRIVKRWVSCQLLMDHLSEITTDLLVAHLFLAPEPYTEPASSLCGFRRFLKLIATYNWEQSPLVVNFDNQIKMDEISKLRDSMSEDRSKYPPIVICTPFDREPSPWTRSNPVQRSLDLLVRICTKAYDYFNTEVILKHEVKDEYKALFRPNFKVFDLLIKLNAQVVQNFFMTFDSPRDFYLRGKESESKKSSAFSVMPIVGLNMVEQYTGLLREHFGHLAWFFHDRYGQRLIGVVMKPESEKELTGDMGKLIADMKKLGSGLIDTITIIKKETE